MNDELQDGGAVASGRHRTVVSIGARSGILLTEELNRVTLDDMLRARVEIRLVDGQYQGYNRITTVNGGEGIVVGTLLGKRLPFEVV